MAAIKTEREKRIYNQALDKAARLVNGFDGIIPDKFERNLIVQSIGKLRKNLKTPLKMPHDL